ncbi:hypothetical protein [Streptomyces liangshanensis]|uniref:Uncharacterized protein n=1 Tax=Streptomyces liangshanensis TaxID=2717324 RepID=A0A6G9GYH0_9ACTN|nr:hypothetical protein [Streptomyces liangshanensis]QIQ03031.1 hypothetical protein HA039_12475 [Streptomyces liangshanensis]
MADGRDQWLDRDVAERLLRGEWAEAVDGRDGGRAKQLSDTLRDMADVTYANGGELPGEAAALAAYRRAAAARTTRAERGGGSVDGASANGVGDAVQDLPGPTVRLAPGSVPARAARHGALRMSLAATLAACALGGLAVAGGGGVLHAELGTGHHSGRAEAETEAGADTGERSPHPLPSDRADGAGTMGGGTGPATPDASVSRGVATSPARGGGAYGGDGAEEPIGPVGKHHDWSAGAPRVKGSTWYSRTAAACLAYRDGKLDEARKEELDRAAKDPARARRFCDWLLEVKATGEGGGKGPGRGHGHGHGGGVKNGNGTGEGSGAGPGDGPTDGTPTDPTGPTDPTDPTDHPHEPHIPTHPPTLGPGSPADSPVPPESSATPRETPPEPPPTPAPTASEQL